MLSRLIEVEAALVLSTNLKVFASLLFRRYACMTPLNIWARLIPGHESCAIAEQRRWRLVAQKHLAKLRVRLYSSYLLCCLRWAKFTPHSMGLQGFSLLLDTVMCHNCPCLQSTTILVYAASRCRTHKKLRELWLWSLWISWYFDR